MHGSDGGRYQVLSQHLRASFRFRAAGPALELPVLKDLGVTHTGRPWRAPSRVFFLL